MAISYERYIAICQPFKVSASIAIGAEDANGSLLDELPPSNGISNTSDGDSVLDYIMLDLVAVLLLHEHLPGRHDLPRDDHHL